MAWATLAVVGGAGLDLDPGHADGALASDFVEAAVALLVLVRCGRQRDAWHVQFDVYVKGLLVQLARCGKWALTRLQLSFKQLYLAISTDCFHNLDFFSTHLKIVLPSPGCPNVSDNSSPRLPSDLS